MNLYDSVGVKLDTDIYEQELKTTFKNVSQLVVIYVKM